MLTQIDRLLKVAGRNMRLTLQDCLLDVLRVYMEIAYNDPTVEDVQQLTLQESYETLEAAIRAQGSDIASLLWARRICGCKLLPPTD